MSYQILAAAGTLAEELSKARMGELSARPLHSHFHAPCAFRNIRRWAQISDVA